MAASRQLNPIMRKNILKKIKIIIREGRSADEAVLAERLVELCAMIYGFNGEEPSHG